MHQATATSMKNLMQTAGFWPRRRLTEQQADSAHPHQRGVYADAPHILVVDDELTLRHFLRSSLESVGYTVSEANNEQEVLAIFQSNQIDLVLMDVQLSTTDGYRLCATLRKTSNIPIMIISSACEPSDIVQGFHAGANEYLAKPFQLREIETRIQQMLHKSRID